MGTRFLQSSPDDSAPASSTQCLMSNAKPPLMFAPASSAPFAQQVASSLSAPLANSEEREFDGGEHKMRPLQDVRDQDVYVIQRLHGDRTSSANDKLCRLLFFVGALKDAGAARVTACLPYLPYARKDRRTQLRDPVTTRYVAGLFESVGTDRLVVLDVHNEAAFDNAFRIQTIRLEAADIFAQEFAGVTGDLVVASPDAGGMKRAHEFRSKLEQRCRRSIGTAFMEKARSGGVISGESFVGDVGGAQVVIYDDLIASGATVLRTANAARKHGATKVHVAASHGVFTDAARQLFEAAGPDTVLVSDSIPLRDDFRSGTDARLRVCTVTGLFAETIRRLHTGSPLGDLSRTG